MSTEWTTVGKTRTESANRFAGLGSGAGAGAYQPRSQKMTVTDPAYEARQARRREAEADMLRNEAERVRLQEMNALAKKKELENLNYSSETFYPSLGTPTKTITPQNGAWGKKLDLLAPATLQPKKHIIENTPDIPYAYEDYEDDFINVLLRRDDFMVFRPLMTPNQYRDTTDDEEYEADEIVMNYESEQEEISFSDSEEEDQGQEFNANTITDRRRGDNGVW